MIVRLIIFPALKRGAKFLRGLRAEVRNLDQSDPLRHRRVAWISRG